MESYQSKEEIKQNNIDISNKLENKENQKAKKLNLTKEQEQIIENKYVVEGNWSTVYIRPDLVDWEGKGYYKVLDHSGNYDVVYLVEIIKDANNNDQVQGGGWVSLSEIKEFVIG